MTSVRPVFLQFRRGYFLISFSISLGQSLSFDVLKCVEIILVAQSSIEVEKLLWPDRLDKWPKVALLYGTNIGILKAGFQVIFVSALYRI